MAGMSFSMVPLLAHSPHVPEKGALRAALGSSPGQRRHLLETAVRILHRESNVDCADARELVGLPSPGAC